MDKRNEYKEHVQDLYDMYTIGRLELVVGKRWKKDGKWLKPSDWAIVNEFVAIEERYKDDDDDDDGNLSTGLDHNDKGADFEL